jgi:hypothetical protein
VLSATNLVNGYYLRTPESNENWGERYAPNALRGVGANRFVQAAGPRWHQKISLLPEIAASGVSLFDLIAFLPRVLYSEDYYGATRDPIA